MCAAYVLPAGGIMQSDHVFAVTTFEKATITFAYVQEEAAAADAICMANSATERASSTFSESAQSMLCTVVTRSEEPPHGTACGCKVFL
jgi:hypothetical protein